MKSSEEAVLFTLERAAFQLRRFEVYNWGPFSGMHAAEIDPQGTAIIGMTGSGKTTLIDGFVTLLTEYPKYNLASTGGHESDRSLMAYVRGVVGSGNDSGDAAHISRKGKTMTGLCATYSDGEEELRLAAIIWIDSTSFAVSDLKRAWLFSRDPRHSLEQWLSVHSQGGLRLLKQQLRDQDEAHLYDASNGGKRAYLARVRSFFEVSDNAFTLLNRAAGLKQLNSIDVIFRESVLDDRSAFDRAAEVADDFNNLAEIHQELETAERQQQSLLPVKKLFADYHVVKEELALKRKLSDLLTVWFALQGKRLWQSRLVELEASRHARKKELEEAQSAVDKAQREVEMLQEKYLKAGGSDVDSLRQLLETFRKDATRLRKNATDYQTLCQKFNLPHDITETSFTSAQEKAKTLCERSSEEQQTASDLAYKTGGESKQADAKQQEIDFELSAAKGKPDSNIPGHYQRFRDLLAAELNIDTDALPYAGELVQVREAESGWRGAIERAMGGNRLRLLVPQDKLKAALRWVNIQEHGLHIRLLEADSSLKSAADFFNDGFLRKLEYKPHPLRDSLKVFLASYDLHCVDSPEELEYTPHGLTREGLISGKRGLFEKKDQRPLDQDWCTGFSNRDRLASLSQQLNEAKRQAEAAGKAFSEAREHDQRLQQQIRLLEALLKLSFEEINYPALEAKIVEGEKKLKELTDPQSDAGRALKDYEDSKKVKDGLDKARDEALLAHNSVTRKTDGAREQIEACLARVGDGLSFEDQQLADAQLSISTRVEAENLTAEENRQRTELASAIQQQQSKLNEQQNSLVRAMMKAKEADTGALAEAGTDMEDIPAYLFRLRVLTEEALPAKRKRFLDYLTRSSDQGVNQLLASVEEEVARIEERINDLNQSLESVDFKLGRFLKLETQKVVHESLRSFERARKQLRAAALRTEDNEGHYRALQAIILLLREAVDKKHTVGARALLDPRYRVEFHGVEIERSSGEVKERFKGSQGGSGGEKEIIASYILTASLCYALSPEGGRFPLHSTIVLDEAFSKSSRAVANRIVNALREFKLHPIFVTPNKEMRLLRTHTRSVVYVHRKESRATLASISWRELEERLDRKSVSPEATDTTTKA